MYQRVGSKRNLVKRLMGLLADVVCEQDIYSAISLLDKIKDYQFSINKPVYFFYDKVSGDELFLTENKDEVDWESELVVEIVLSNKQQEGYGLCVHL